MYFFYAFINIYLSFICLLIFILFVFRGNYFSWTPVYFPRDRNDSKANSNNNSNSNNNNSNNSNSNSNSNNNSNNNNTNNSNSIL